MFKDASKHIHMPERVTSADPSVPNYDHLGHLIRKLFHFTQFTKYVTAENSRTFFTNLEH